MRKRQWWRDSWEYWPFHVVYGPVYPVFAAMVLACRGRFFANAANPVITNGGFLMESKKQIYDLLPAGTYPATRLCLPGTRTHEVMNWMRSAGIPFPIVLKPDTGSRGRAVIRVDNEEQLDAFLPCYTIPFLAQAWVDLPQEAGIFYVRMPGENTGRITGIVGKYGGQVTGDGRSTLQQLVAADDRLQRQHTALAQIHAARWKEVIPDGEILQVVPYGNHARGALFLDESHRIHGQLLHMIEDVILQVPGFCFGRLDIRFRSWTELMQGGDWQIIELNGSGSEPTHIYDPSCSLWQGWREIIRHWWWLWRISRANHRRGTSYMTLAEARRMYRADQELSLHLAEVDAGLRQAASTLRSEPVS